MAVEDIQPEPHHTGVESLQYEEKKLEPELENEADVKVAAGWSDPMTAEEKGETKKHLQVLGDELDEYEGMLDQMTLDRTFKVIQQLYTIHAHDLNFPRAVLDRMEELLTNSDVSSRPEKHEDLIREMKLEALLATENSPYIEVRANVDPTDDVNIPSWTFRVLVIGTIFSCAGSFIDTFFGYRYPPISVGAMVGQLLAYPAGKFMERLPTHKWKLFGYEMSLNPGKFSRKEHMLIFIMANVSFTAPYTNYIVPTQALPVFFGQKFAYNRGYQFINTIATNFIGYGLAGLCRRFLVYPSVAVWPATLLNIGLVKAFHTEVNEPVKGPFGRTYTASREKCFLYCFLAMFVWYWFPSYLFQALSSFSWITWIAPNNATLDTVSGFYGGMGLNPWPTFDWNVLTVWLSPLTIPTFAIVNQFIGIVIGALMCLGVYYRNDWNTGYIPINSNSAFDNTASHYNVSRILNDDGFFDNEKYQEYSEPWMSAGFVVSYLWYFALYSATATWVIMYHRYEVTVGFKGLWKSAKKMFKKEMDSDEDDLSEDVHYRLMQAYPEAPEWWYLVVLIISIVLGMVGVGVYPTHTSPVVVIFGIIMPLIAMIPTGLIQAVTGIPVPLNVLAEFIGGSLVEGNANGLMYFKTYGYIATYQAVYFCNDLKLAHYMKIPPRHTFMAQMYATMLYCIVSTLVLNFAMGFKDVCTPDAAFGFTCANQRTFFTAAVFWGTLSPNKLFGPGRRYNLMLLGFPLGVIMVLAYWGARKIWPKSELLRQLHPVMITAGPSTWGSPYNTSWFIGNVYLVILSFQIIRKRYLAFWAKYNYVVAAAFPAGIAISAIVIFFGLQVAHGGINVVWWGNTITGAGCEGAGGCPNLVLDDGAYFGNAPGSGKFL